ncbi:MAG: T9SS type A sorting domain-containing protein [Chitinophagales bacterium]|nr:T9SS type A sorting domain-containing protein [Chitinophagales bacterium]
MKRLISISILFLFTFSIGKLHAQCTSCTTTISSSNGSNQSVNGNKTLCFTGGTFTGKISKITSNGTICVGSNATFSPSELDKFNGTINVYGTAYLPEFTPKSNAKINNYGTVIFQDEIDFDKDIEITNAVNATMIFETDVNMNAGSTITNNGNIIFNEKLNVPSGNTFTSTNTARISSTVSTGGTFTNSGLMVVANGITITGGTFVNNCRLVTKSFSNSGSSSTNNGFIWTSGSSAAITNSGIFTQSSNGEVRGKDFTNSGTVKGFGKYYLTGSTTNSGYFGNDGKGINFYDVSVSGGGSKKFDSQPTSPHSSVVRNSFTPSDTLSATPGSCSSNHCQPITANAGSDQTKCTSRNFTMSANTVSGATGAWSVVGGDVSIATANSATTSVTLNSGATATLRWTLTNSCSSNSSDVIINYSSFSATTTATNTTCGLCNDGSIEVKTTGGNTPFTFAWNDGSNLQDRIKLANGNYSVTITDNSGCTNVLSDTVLLPLAVNVASLSACNLANGGAAQANVSGGKAPYTYSWNTGETSPTISDLASGTYTVTVTDAQAKTKVQTVSISNTMVNITFSPSAPVICRGDTVKVTANGALSYSWSPAIGLSATNIADPKAAPLTTTTYTVSTVASSNDLVTNGNFDLGNTGFTSAYGFISPSANAATGGKGLQPEGRFAVDTSAASYHNNFTGLDNSGSGKFMIINGATIAGQAVWKQTILVQPNTAYNFSTFISSVNEANPANLRFQINGVVLGPNITASTTRGRWAKFTAAWNSGANTSAEIAILNDNTIAGGNDFGLDDISFTSTCVSSSQIAVTVNQPPTVNFAKEDISCNGLTDGNITVSASGTLAPYTYKWNTGSTLASISNLGIGTYSVTVKDGKTCTKASSVNIAQPAVLSATAIGTNVSCKGQSNGSITLNITGGTTPYTYIWSNGASTQNISGLVAGSYSVTVQDAHNCTKTTAVVITEPIGQVLTANAGTDTTRIGGSSTFKMNANAPGSGASGLWSLVSGTATISTPSSNISNVTVQLGNEAALEWKITSGACIVRDTVVIKHQHPSGCIAISSGEWNLASTWSGNCNLPLGYPGINDTALVSGKTITISGSSACKLLVMTNESGIAKVNLQSTGTLTVTNNIEISATAQSTAIINLAGNAKMYLGGTLKRNAAPQNFGRITSASNSTIYFNGTQQQIIPSSCGKGDDGIEYQNIVLNNTSGLSPAFIAEGKIEVNNTITLTKGCLDMGRDTIMLRNNSSTSAKGGSDSSFIMGQFCRYIGESGKTYRWSVGRNGEQGEYWFELKNNLLVGTSYVCVEFDSVPEDSKQGIDFQDQEITASNLSPEGIWRVEPNAQPLLGSYDVKVSTQHFSGLVDDNFGLLKRPSRSAVTNWGKGGGLLPLLGSVNRLTSSLSTTLNTLTSFSEFGIGNGGGGALPVKLSLFEAKPIENKFIRLKWVTETEIDNMGFEIHRSTDGKEFSNIGWVNGNGNTTETIVYNYDDKTIDPNIRYYYRLKQLDFDGDSEFTPIASAEIHNKTGVLEIGNFTPNPAKNSTAINITTDEDFDAKFTFFDVMGKVAKTGAVSLTKGTHLYYFDINELTAGNYVVAITTHGSTHSKKLIVY